MLKTLELKSKHSPTLVWNQTNLAPDQIRMLIFCLMFFKTGKKKKEQDGHADVFVVDQHLLYQSYIIHTSSTSLIYIAYPLPQDTRFTGTFIRNWHLGSEMVFLHHTNFIDTMGNQSRIHGPVSILCVCTCCIFHLDNMLVSVCFSDTFSFLLLFRTSNVRVRV